jgi:hypothetical protein
VKQVAGQHDKPNSGAQNAPTSECGENVTAPRGQDKAHPMTGGEAKERLHPGPTFPLSQVKHHFIP